MDAVRDVMPTALAEVLRRMPLSADKVTLAWRAAVGPALARATTAELREAVLHVRARDRAWQQETERSAILIRARLATLLGPGVVRYLHVTTG